MSGLGGLAALGHFAGGAVKGYDSALEEQRKQDEADFIKSERERDAALRDEIAKASGMNPEQVTTPSGPAVQSAQEGGGLMQPMPTIRHSMGGQEQAQPFTPEQVQGLRTEQIANALQKRGNVASLAAADTLRTNAMQREAGGLQIKKTKLDLAHAEAASKGLEWSRRLAAGEDFNDIYKELQQANGLVKNGYGATAPVDVDGVPHVVIFNEQSGEKQLVPLNKDTVKQMVGEFYKFSSTQAYADAQKHEQEQKKIGLKEREVTTAEAKQKSDEKVAGAHITYYDRAGRAALMNASNRGDAKPSWNIIGTDSDGEAIQHDKSSGNFKRRDGKPIQDVNFFKKITGAAAVAEDPVRDAMIKGISTGRVTPAELAAYDAQAATRARQAKAMGGGGYTPGAQGGPAPAQAPAAVVPPPPAQGPWTLGGARARGEVPPQWQGLPYAPLNQGSHANDPTIGELLGR